MKHAHRTDFWFAGVAILPVVFLCAGRPEGILMLYLPLLLVACLFGIYEQKMESEEPQAPQGLDNRTSCDDGESCPVIAHDKSAQA